MKHNRHRLPGKPRVSPTVLDRINTNVAGIDCGAAEHYVAVPSDRDPSAVSRSRRSRVTKKPRDNEPRFEIRTPLHHLTGGIDLTQIDGIAPYTALKLISEMGELVYRDPGADAYDLHSGRVHSAGYVSGPPPSVSNWSAARPAKSFHGSAASRGAEKIPSTEDLGVQPEDDCLVLFG